MDTYKDRDRCTEKETEREPDKDRYRNTERETDREPVRTKTGIQRGRQE